MCADCTEICPIRVCIDGCGCVVCAKRNHGSVGLYGSAVCHGVSPVRAVDVCPVRHFTAASPLVTYRHRAEPAHLLEHLADLIDRRFAIIAGSKACDGIANEDASNIHG